jgi:ATP-dependent RNA helicase RhlE
VPQQADFRRHYLTCSFESLGLAAALTRAVAEEGYTIATPIQAQAIPSILAGRDVLAGAQTGTGKTAAFALPILHRLASHTTNSTSPARHPIRVLVLTPTRELAAQVEQSFRTYGRHLPVRTTVVYGGVGIQPQVATLRRGVDVLVATPGRLLDHVQQKTVDLSRVEILVLDEADRMLDMGFIRDIRRVLALLPAKRQNLLFSATFSDEIRRLADGLLHDPVPVEVARRNADSELTTQRLHMVSQDRKRQLLAHLVSTGGWNQVLVFARTKHGANRLAEQLDRAGISATAIHGNKSQPQRMKALADFKQGNARVLVATDIAARGLDIDALPHVVNFELPTVPEDYVHRIGRTGRAGNSGEAISLVSPDERPQLAAIERLLGRRIERQPVPGFDGIQTQADEPDTRPARQPARNERSNRSSQPRAQQRSEQPRHSKPAHHSKPAKPAHARPANPGHVRPAEPAREIEARPAGAGNAFVKRPKPHTPHIGALLGGRIAD